MQDLVVLPDAVIEQQLREKILTTLPVQTSAGKYVPIQSVALDTYYPAWRSRPLIVEEWYTDEDGKHELVKSMDFGWMQMSSRKEKQFRGFHSEQRALVSAREMSFDRANKENVPAGIAVVKIKRTWYVQEIARNFAFKEDSVSATWKMCTFLSEKGKTKRFVRPAFSPLRYLVWQDQMTQFEEPLAYTIIL